jgi:hypothetical protein
VTGFLRGEIVWLAAASLCILLFPLVHAPIGLAAILIVAILVIRRAIAGDTLAFISVLRERVAR